MRTALFVAAFFAAYTLQAITGFAGNIFAMPVGTYLLGLADSVSVLNTMGFFACAILAMANLRHVRWHELARICLTMLPFVLLGMWIDSVAPLDALLRLYGGVVLVVGIYNLVVKKAPELPEWAMWVVLALAGLVQGMFVSGGALLVIYATQKLPEKDEFRATLSAVWAILNLIYALIRVATGVFTMQAARIALLCAPFALAATWLGSRIQRRINQQAFLRLTFAVLIAIGLVMLVLGA